MRHTTKIRYLLIICATLFFIALPAQAQTSQATIDKIIEETGINRLIAATPRLALAALKQSAFAVDEPKVNSQLNGAFSNAFTTENIERDIQKQLTQNMTQPLADRYLALLSEPEWMKLAKMERASSDPKNREEMMQFAEALKQQAAPASRMALIERLDQANRTSEFSTNLQLAFFRSVFSAINPVLDADMKIDDEELGKMQDEVRKTIAKDIKQHVQFSYLYAFRTLGDAELKRYVELSESDTNTKSNALLTKAVIDSIDKAAQRAARSMRIVSKN